MDDTGMIERVAAAILVALKASDDTAFISPHTDGDGNARLTIDGHFDPNALARAAIEAMREPTPGMVAVVVREVYPNDQGFSEWEAEACWGSMIDAALASPQ